MTSDELRSLVRYEVENKIITIAELAREIGSSRTCMSLWLHEKLHYDARAIEAKLRRYYSRKSLSIRDQIVMDKLLEILNTADDRNTLIENLTAAFGN